MAGRVTSAQILNDDHGPLLRRMALPMVIGIFASMTFQLIDTYFVSFLGTQELAAMGFIGPVAFTVINLSIGLGIATSVMVGNAIGQGNHDKAARITTESLALSLLIVFGVSLLGLMTIDPLFRALKAEEATLPLIHEYMDIWYWFVGFMLLPILANGAIRATGDTKWPSIIMIVGGVVNVILDPILIFGWGPIPRMELAGAAWATVIGWGVGFFAAFYLLWWREKLLLFVLPPLQELLSVWRRVFKLAAPISVANMLSPLSAVILTRMIADYGEPAVAAFGAGARIEALTFVIPLACTAALSPFMAQNLGALKNHRALDALWGSLKFLLVLQLITWALLAVFSGPIAGLFSDDESVKWTIQLYLIIMPAGLAAYSLVIVINTAFNAAQQSHRTMNVSLIRLFLLLIPCAWIGSEFYGIPGFFVGAVIGNVLTVFVSLISFKRMNLGAGGVQSEVSS